ncbi:hypothetical protein [Umezakia ovalisporum]|uniref:Uncharacterized protein n=1 Tax=Umezakia ovalisporum FSS-43 TaxID=2740520 RepID=A0ABT6K891_9CYAN|nr:hypothetical protein [Umezakia ovalisporum]MDH6058245.1 hypothetical protein [Umezakia ovalisporum FSS-43]MDH6066986.1 hypothetical protein [Umezakia ovalisporum APH033B]MDH6072358.1 hypothetical protein [Umezakia ovalisporum CobakiLakeA]MDH6076235.1 hypothetical protein [Umezakia ovalisporum CS-1034]MDH6081587.1 hypothetical protein [Umezakia ovalisporum FSS-44]
MSYINRLGEDVINEPGVPARLAEYHDRVRWGPIIAGVLVALATQLILSSLFGAIGASTIATSGAPRTITPDIAANVGIWSTLALLISLFIGGWVTTRACGPMNRNTALLNGAILWATSLALSSWLLASGVWGTFGIVAPSFAIGLPPGTQPLAPIPPTTITPNQARQIAAATSRALWWFVFGSLLSLAAALIGAVVGARTPRTNNYRT